MKLEFRPNDQKGFYDVVAIDWRKNEVTFAFAGGERTMPLTDGELRVKGEQGSLF